MQTRRWLNPSQPQTLQIAVFLLYLNAVFAVLLGAVASLVGVVIVACEAASGYGIANERRWGYLLGIGVSLLPFLIPLLVGAGIGDVLNYLFTVPGLFAVALVALLLHPQSRDYQRIWFS
ncbi:MAG TPA: hypothetical protein VGB14_09305 [Acidimicrobiales bacterium]|jgi:hypothetical protein